MKQENTLSILQRLLDAPEMTQEGPDDDALIRILEMAKWSPSAANLQPWEIILVTNQADKEKVVQATLDPLMRDEPDSRAFWLTDAPMIIIVCADVKRVRARYGKDRALPIALGDLGGFLLAFRVAASAEGWTTGIVREFDRARMRSAFGIPEFIEPLALIAICRERISSETVIDKPTMDVKDFLHRGKW